MTATVDPVLTDLLRRSLPPGAANDEILPDTNLREAGLSSIGTIDLLMRLEDHYNVRFPDSALNGTTFATPRSLWAVVCRELDKQATVR
jgi:diaminopimelate decarboxylase